MTPYATLAEVKQEMKAGAASNATEDAKVYRHLRAISARFDREFAQRRPLFAPYIEARDIRIDPTAINTYDNALYLGQNLLALSAVSVNGNALTVGSAVEAWPALQSPIRALRLLNYSDSWYGYCSSSAAPSYARVTGIWGFHRDYANAWLAVDTLAAAITTTTATSFTVADVDGADPYGQTPRISAGNLLKIDDEYMEVVSTNTGTNTVTVVRGVNGSTAAAHGISSAVYTWQMEEPVKRAISRQAAFMYARQGAYEQATVDGIGAVSFPPDLLIEVKRIMQEYAYD